MENSWTLTGPMLNSSTSDGPVIATPSCFNSAPGAGTTSIVVPVRLKTPARPGTRSRGQRNRQRRVGAERRLVVLERPYPEDSYREQERLLTLFAPRLVFVLVFRLVNRWRVGPLRPRTPDDRNRGQDTGSAPHPHDWPPQKFYPSRSERCTVNAGECPRVGVGRAP